MLKSIIDIILITNKVGGEKIENKKDNYIYNNNVFYNVYKGLCSRPANNNRRR